MQLAIIGVGALACLFGARLSRVCEVLLIGHWQAQITALQTQPLKIIHENGSIEYAHLNVTSTIPPTPFADIVLILTKSPRTPEAAQLAAKIIKPNGLVITLQNGLGNLGILQEHIPHAHVSLGVTTQGAALDAPAILRLGGEGLTSLASYPALDPQLQEFVARLQQAGLDSEISPTINGLVWGKLAINAAINPLSALLRVQNGTLLLSEFACQIMQSAAREVETLAQAQNITLPFADAATMSLEVAQRTATNRSSMLQDILNKQPTEIEAICGAVIRYGKTLNLPTPTNQMLYTLIKALEETSL